LQQKAGVKRHDEARYGKGGPGKAAARYRRSGKESIMSKVAALRKVVDEAVEGAIGDVDKAKLELEMREMALRHAVAAAKKIPYGPHSAEFVLKLARAFYDFLSEGEGQKPR
jgi:hypothetical protein